MSELKKGTVLSLVGTSKGAFIFRSDARRKKWKIKGPLMKGLTIHHFTFDPRDRETLFAAGGKRLYQQNHCGVYRSDSAGERWTDISKGLPSRFGFCMGVHPEDSETAWVVPITSSYYRACPGGKLSVYRSRNGGRSWQRTAKGLPARNAHLLVLREAMSVDSADPAGVYFGTSTGQLFHTRDESREWSLLADYLPPVYSVEAIGPYA